MKHLQEFINEQIEDSCSKSITFDFTDLEDAEDNIVEEALAKKFGVTKEFAHEVMNFDYYPQIYYIQSEDLYE